MNDILKLLQGLLSFLFDDNRFRFVDSRVSHSFGGDAFVTLQSERLRVRVINDRGQLFLDFQSVDREREPDWFSGDVVRALLTDQRVDSAELDEENAEFVRSHLDEIERRFGSAEISGTEVELRALERERAERLSGR